MKAVIFDYLIAIWVRNWVRYKTIFVYIKLKIRFMQTVEISDYQYKLSMVDTASEEFRLYQNFPQTFYKVTRLAFDLPKRAEVKLMIFDVFGREMAVLIDETLDMGSYEIKWNALNFSPGVYYYKLYAGEFVDSKKMVLLHAVN